MYNRRSERYKYRSWKGGSICLESSAESREYLLIYFSGMGTNFYWGWKHISIGGMGRNFLWDESPHPPGFAPLTLCNMLLYRFRVEHAAQLPSH